MCIVRGNVFDERPRCGVVDVIPGNEVDVDGVFCFWRARLLARVVVGFPAGLGKAF